MTTKQKIFLGSLTLFGVYWFIPLLTSNDLADSAFFMATYLYLPGIALPLIAALTLTKIKPVRLLIYVAVSWGIYYLSVQIFSQDWPGSYYYASCFGALAFLLATDYFLHSSVDFKFQLIGAIAAAIVFVFFDVVEDGGFQVACFLWTVIVGVMIVMGDRRVTMV